MTRRRRSLARLERRADAAGLIDVLAERDVAVEQRGHAIDLSAPRRREAAEALARLPEAPPPEPVLAALNDPWPPVREVLAAALPGWYGEAAVAPLAHAAVAWIGPPLARARAQALAGLEALAGRDGTDVPGALAERLLAAPGAGTVDDQAPAIDAILTHAGDERRDGLARLALRGLDSDDGPVRERASVLLERLGEHAGRILLEALDDATMRGAAVAALGNLRRSDATEALVGVLVSDDAALRRDAAVALEQVQDPRAAPALLRATRDPDPGVRDAAFRAFDALGPVATVLTLAGTLHERITSGALVPGTNGHRDISGLLAEAADGRLAAPAAPAGGPEPAAEPPRRRKGNLRRRRS